MWYGYDWIIESERTQPALFHSPYLELFTMELHFHLIVNRDYFSNSDGISNDADNLVINSYVSNMRFSGSAKIL